MTRTRIAFAFPLLVLVGCGSTGLPSVCNLTPEELPRRTIEPGHSTRNIVLVTIDGARWQEIFQGVDPRLAKRRQVSECEGISGRALLPNIYRDVVDTGVALGAPGRGESMRASGPNFVSQPGYLEIFSGRPSAVCRRNGCSLTAESTVLDDLQRQQGLSAKDLAVISSWENFEQVASNHPRSITISAGRHHGTNRDLLRVTPRASALLDAGAQSEAAPGLFDYRPDRFTGELALEYLSAQKPRFLAVGFGDTDEYAHFNNYRGYLASLRRVDRFIGALFRTLDALGEYGQETTVILTADHGRASNFTGHGGSSPESSRVWLLAAGGAIAEKGIVTASRGYRLADIAPTVRSLLQLSPDTSARAGSPIADLLSTDLGDARLAELKRALR